MSQIDQPEAGYYRTRQVRGGPWCAVRIWHGPPVDPHTGEELDRAPRWQATIDGREADAMYLWPYCGGNRIDEAEYNYLMATSAYAKQHAPDHPAADPMKPIDHMHIKPPF